MTKKENLDEIADILEVMRQGLESPDTITQDAAGNTAMLMRVAFGELFNVGWNEIKKEVADAS